MTNRRAFSLLELIVSIAVSGIIALLVYGSAAAGFDTRDRLARHRAGAESDLRARALLVDALRHASDEADAGAAAFELTDASDLRGLPADTLAFLTRGVLPPFGASALWIVSLVPTERGVLLHAEPVITSARESAPPGAVDRRHGVGLSTVLSGVVGVDVQSMVLAERRWSSTWASPAQLPAAVRITFYDTSGAVVGPPVVARLGLEGMP